MLNCEERPCCCCQRTWLGLLRCVLLCAQGGHSLCARQHHHSCLAPVVSAVPVVLADHDEQQRPDHARAGGLDTAGSRHHSVGGTLLLLCVCLPSALLLLDKLGRSHTNTYSRACVILLCARCRVCVLCGPIHLSTLFCVCLPPLRSPRTPPALSDHTIHPTRF